MERVYALFFREYGYECTDEIFMGIFSSIEIAKEVAQKNIGKAKYAQLFWDITPESGYLVGEAKKIKNYAEYVIIPCAINDIIAEAVF